MKVVAQTWYPAPGQVFYATQQVDEIDTRAGGRRDALRGGARAAGAHRRPWWRRLPEPAGSSGSARSSTPAEVDLGREAGRGRGARGRGPPRAGIGGLARSDTAIRDMHPALFLARLRARCPACR